MLMRKFFANTYIDQENNMNDHSNVPPGQFIICRILHTLGILCSDFLPPGNPVRLTLNLVLYLGLELQIYIAIIAMDTWDTRKNKKYY